MRLRENIKKMFNKNKKKQFFLYKIQIQKF